MLWTTFAIPKTTLTKGREKLGASMRYGSAATNKKQKQQGEGLAIHFLPPPWFPPLAS
jgi:hypothetical protein